MSPNDAPPEKRNGTAGGLGRERILAVTDDCLRAWGYDATTIRAIAGELPCAVGSIYRHFPDKRSLLRTVAERQLEPAARAAEDRESGPVTSSAALYHARASADPDRYRLMFWLAGTDPLAPSDALPETVRRVVEAWALRMNDRAAAERSWALIHGAVLLAHADGKIHGILEEIRERERAAAPQPATPERIEDVSLL